MLQIGRVGRLRRGRRSLSWFRFAAASLAVGLVVAALVAISNGRSDSRVKGGQAALRPGEAMASAGPAATIQGEGWAASLQHSQIAATNVAIVLGSRASVDIAVVIDKASETEFGRVSVSSPPWAVVRTTANQILLSDLTHAGGRLLIFNTFPTFSLYATVELRDRAQSTAYSPGMALSGDQRFLFYLKLANGCAPAPRTSLACDRHQVGVVDLSRSTETAAVDLPRACGFGLLSPGIGSSDVKVLCPNIGTVVSVTNGSSTVLASFPQVSRSRIDTPPAVRPYLADRDAAGNWFLLLDNGTIVRANGQTLKLQLPQQGNIHWAQIYLQPDGTYLLGIASYGGNSPNKLLAVARFDAKRLRILSSAPVPDDAIFFAPERGNVIRVLSTSGVARTFDLSTAQTLLDVATGIAPYALVPAP